MQVYGLDFDRLTAWLATHREATNLVPFMSEFVKIDQHRIARGEPQLYDCITPEGVDFDAIYEAMKKAQMVKESDSVVGKSSW